MPNSQQGSLLPVPARIVVAAARDQDADSRRRRKRDSGLRPHSRQRLQRLVRNVEGRETFILLSSTPNLVAHIWFARRKIRVAFGTRAILHCNVQTLSIGFLQTVCADRVHSSAAQGPLPCAPSAAPRTCVFRRSAPVAFFRGAKSAVCAAKLGRRCVARTTIRAWPPPQIRH